MTVGTLWAWGYNNYGQLGQSNVINYSSPIQIGSGTSWVSGSSTVSSYEIRSDGSLWAWGNNTYGQLGFNNTTSNSSPVQVGALSNWSQVCAANSWVLALKTDGTLWAWGYNASGQLGQGDRTNRSSPTQIGSGTNWATISAALAGFAITTAGTLWSWGSGFEGVLGLATDNNSRSSPTQVGALTTWAQVVTNFASTYAIKTDGTLWAWGWNNYGQLGQNNTTLQTFGSPVQIGSATTWTALGAGAVSAFAIAGGILWAWGRNNYGQLGLGDVSNRSSPVNVGSLTNWTSVAGGTYITVATQSGDTLWTWGRNNYGQLGQGDTTNRSSPVQIGSNYNWLSASLTDSTVLATQGPNPTQGQLWGWGYDSTEHYIGLPSTTPLSTPKQVGIGVQFSIIGTNGWIAIDDNQHLWIWPVTQAAQDIAPSLAPIPYPLPTQVGTSTWSAAVLGTDVGLGIQTGGTLWVWGINGYGALGVGSSNQTLTYNSPTQLGAGTTWSQVFAGRNCFAIKTDGTLWAWGWNNYGQLGLGDITNRSSPVQVGGLTNWSYVTARGGSIDINYYPASLAIKTDGTLWAWGYNGQGQLGLGDTTNRSSPVQVGAGTNWAAVTYSGASRGKGEGSEGSSFAIKTDGTLWAWGSNAYGQLGLGSTTSYSSPVQVGALTTWVSVQSGAYSVKTSTIALKSDGTIWSWGDNTYGQLGLGNTTSVSSPVQIGSATNWSKVFASLNGEMWATTRISVVWQDSAQFNGAGNLSATVRLALQALVVFTGAGSLSAFAASGLVISASFAGTGSLSYPGTLGLATKATLNDNSPSLTAYAALGHQISATFAGAGLLSAAAGTAPPGGYVAILGGAGSFSATITQQQNAAFVDFAGAGSLLPTVYLIGQIAATFNGKGRMGLPLAGASEYDGAGNLSADTVQIHRASLFTGFGSLSANGVRVVNVSNQFHGVGRMCAQATVRIGRQGPINNTMVAGPGASFNITVGGG